MNHCKTPPLALRVQLLCLSRTCLRVCVPSHRFSTLRPALSSKKTSLEERFWTHPNTDSAHPENAASSGAQQQQQHQQQQQKQQTQPQHSQHSQPQHSQQQQPHVAQNPQTGSDLNRSGPDHGPHQHHRNQQHVRQPHQLAGDHNNNVNVNANANANAHSHAQVEPSTPAALTRYPTWDALAAQEAFFSGARPLLSTTARFSRLGGAASPHLARGDVPASAEYLSEARRFVDGLKTLRDEGASDGVEEMDAVERAMRDVACTVQVAAHRPLSMYDSAEDFAKYKDEYAKIFNCFGRSLTFDLPVSTSVAEDCDATFATNIDGEQTQTMGDQQFLTLLQSSFRQHISSSGVPVVPTIPVPLEAPTAAERQSAEEIQAITVVKRRRKKMNKHKWKKRRREVRDSKRYNKERKKHEGVVREKKE